ncbi:MAG: class I SAM-dependent methyltransferase [Planctomycetes bacterium]|nr:class I SAM-dependent methyltransferase [Planctomycetota bacterium]
MVNQRYLTEKGARDYAVKYQKSLLRRLSARREAAAVRNALERAGASGSVLDLPCGAGRFTGMIRRRAALYCAADFSMHMLRICTAQTRVADDRLAVMTDVHAIGMKDRSFDGVVSIRLLHHLPDDRERRAVMAEIARLAKRFLVVTFLDADSFKQRLHAWKRGRRELPVKRAAVPRTVMEDDLARVGFQVLDFYGLSSFFSGQTVAACVRREET